MDLPLHPELGSWTVLDYLALLWPDVAQRAIQGLFAQGRIRSGERPVAAGRPVGELQDLVLVGSLDGVPRMYLGNPTARLGIEILHEDARLVAVTKPSGVPVVPDREKALGSVLGFLVRRELEARRAKSPADYVRCRIVHRIDRWTSGLVLVARTPEAERRLSADFEGRRVKKEYLAILRGVVAPARIAVSCPVVPGRKGKMRAELREGAGGALTELDVLERFDGFTLVRARPLTGRTHQIRVHAWAAGHPLAVDPLYGARGEALPAPPAIERLTLHAHRCELPGDWEEPRAFECPPPADFQAALAALRDPGCRTPPSGG
ncbi:MAG: RluA family pseudouridine synthase [Planctomycetes bacterium]|nr:RluA family pseudouridine synthase [Planctomycetota bacterium]